MTTSEVTNFDQTNRKVTPIDNTSIASEQKTLFTLKLFEYLLLAAFFSAGIVILVYSDNQQAVVGGAIALTVAIFLFLVNRQAFQDSQNSFNQSQLNKKAELFSYLLSDNNSAAKNALTPARGKALQYCQDLINDYRKTRDISRNVYYVLQISTVVLSGVTPILVLVDKLEAGQAWLKWLPVICPALASIVASIVTSFPFQKNWVAANTAVELLEAEQEKFILGVTPPYRCYDVSDEVQQQQRINQALEYFIVQVNNIHLQQVQQTNESQPEKKEAEASPDSKS
ncbi:DUF4231 domain-containing protein [Fortiea contorta]|uniref:DUF4231 domain-containing protein n=1 Tax=Fortiea contorta TaxID=1892405 RepID=UPI00034D775B|nr:DUF4231 domain-containing protein [Fortiea contorta]